MEHAVLEHVNVTVKDPDATAKMLCDLFGWHVRWSGDAINGGYSVHVGTADQYIVVYTGTPGKARAPAHDSYNQIGGLNHIGVVVGDLDATEDRVKALGFTPINHADYEPGRRFYFRDHDNIEIEVVSYGDGHA